MLPPPTPPWLGAPIELLRDDDDDDAIENYQDFYQILVVFRIGPCDGNEYFGQGM
jgi:hypothetical protein